MPLLRWQLPLLDHGSELDIGRANVIRVGFCSVGKERWQAAEANCNEVWLLSSAQDSHVFFRCEGAILMAIPDRTDAGLVVDNVEDTQCVTEEEGVEVRGKGTNCTRNFREVALP